MIIAAINKIGKYSSDFCYFFACFIIIAMTALIYVEVFSRALFGVSTQLEDEFGGYALVCVAFLPLARSYREGVHIRIVSLIERLPRGVQAFAKVLERLCLFIVAALLCWEGAAQAQSSWAMDAKAQTVAGTPLWCVQIVIPLGLLLLLFPLTADLFKSVGALVSGKYIGSHKIDGTSFEESE
jgi:C4-dicarboxylate transporter, DctQ subunit